MKSLTLILCAALAGYIPYAVAETAVKSKAASTKERNAAGSKKKKSVKAAAGATAAGAAAGISDDEKEPDIATSTATEYNCELGNKVTIYSNAADDKSIAMRWKTRLMRMTRVDTTTGANRFENRHLGLVWLGIPAKGILLDSKKGQQLANECKNAEQMAPRLPSVNEAPVANQLIPQT